MSFTQRTITFTRLNEDDTDATGTITFQLTAPITDGTTTITPTPIVSTLESGAGSEVLNANDDPTTEPTGTSYVVVERIVNAPIVAYEIVVPHEGSGSIDLDTLGHATVSPAYSYILASMLGQAGGVAELDDTGKVPTDELPSDLGGGLTGFSSPDGSITNEGSLTDLELEVTPGTFDASGAAAAAQSAAEAAATSDVATETTRAEAAEATLTTDHTTDAAAISAETTRAEAAEATLTTDHTTDAAAISAETTRAEAAESSDLTTAESVAASDVATETTRAEGVEAGLAELLANLFSVVEYGADATGATDSSTAFENAIAAAKTAAATYGGATFWMPAGSYKIGPAAFIALSSATDANVAILGAGVGCTLITPTSGQAAVISKAITATTPTGGAGNYPAPIAGFTIDGVNMGSGAVGVQWSGVDGQYIDVLCRNFDATPDTTWPGSGNFGGIGFSHRNTSSGQAYNERTYYGPNCDAYNCFVNYDLDAYTGNPSLARTRGHMAFETVQPGQTGVRIHGSQGTVANLYDCDLDVFGNLATGYSGTPTGVERAPLGPYGGTALSTSGSTSSLTFAQRTDTATWTTSSSTIADSSIAVTDQGSYVSGAGISGYVGAVVAGTSFTLVNANGVAITPTAAGTAANLTVGGTGYALWENMVLLLNDGDGQTWNGNTTITVAINQGSAYTIKPSQNLTVTANQRLVLVNSSGAYAELLVQTSGTYGPTGGGGTSIPVLSITGAAAGNAYTTFGVGSQVFIDGNKQAVMVRRSNSGGGYAKGSTTVNVFNFTARETFASCSVVLAPVGILVGAPQSSSASATDASQFVNSRLAYLIESNDSGVPSTVPIFVNTGASMLVGGQGDMASYCRGHVEVGENTGGVEGSAGIGFAGVWAMPPHSPQPNKGGLLASSQLWSWTGMFPSPMGAGGFASNFLMPVLPTFKQPQGTYGGYSVVGMYANSSGNLVFVGSGQALQFWTGATTGAEFQMLTSGIFQAAALQPVGLTGATAAARFVGGIAAMPSSGTPALPAPASGTFAVGDGITDQSGAKWFCTSAGSPGTWNVAGVIARYDSAVLTASLVNQQIIAQLPATGSYRLTWTAACAAGVSGSGYIELINPTVEYTDGDTSASVTWVDKNANALGSDGTGAIYNDGVLQPLTGSLAFQGLAGSSYPVTFSITYSQSATSSPGYRIHIKLERTG